MIETSSPGLRAMMAQAVVGWKWFFMTMPMPSRRASSARVMGS